MSKDSIASVIMAKAAEMTDREAELAMAVAAAILLSAGSHKGAASRLAPCFVGGGYGRDGL